MLLVRVIFTRRVFLLIHGLAALRSLLFLLLLSLLFPPRLRLLFLPGLHSLFLFCLPFACGILFPSLCGLVGEILAVLFLFHFERQL